MTLIEVLAGMILLGTILASLVIARGRYVRQSSLAGQRIKAAAAADALLNTWWQQRTGVPIQAGGTIDANLTWQTSPIQDPGAAALNNQVVRVRILRKTSNENAPEPVLSIDVLTTQPTKIDPGQP